VGGRIKILTFNQVEIIKAYLKNLPIHHWMEILLPIFLGGFELIVREIAEFNLVSFLGPTLAISGIGMIISAFEPREISRDLEKEEIHNLYKRENQRLFLLIPALLIAFLFWCASCLWSFKSFTEVSLVRDSTEYSYAIFAVLIGCFAYLMGVFITVKNYKP